jgi:hypothetical protein
VPVASSACAIDGASAAPYSGLSSGAVMKSLVSARAPKIDAPLAY